MIYYIHGFNSGIKKDRIELLSKLLETEVIGLEYKSEESYFYNLGYLDSQIRKLGNPDAIIGTSLGAFYAQNLSREYNCMTVLINPCLNPKETLTKWIGTNTNYATGNVYDLKEKIINTYDVNELTFNTQTLVILATGDELFDYTTSYNELYGRCEIVTFEGGCHSFDNYAEIASDIDYFLKTPVLMN